MAKKQKETKIKEASVELPKDKLTKAWMYAITSLFILALYGGTVKYDYTLDDDLFNRAHSSVQKGLQGIPEIFSQGSLTGNNGRLGQQPYRPITLTTFALDKAIAGNNPSYSHFINVLLYMLVAIVFIQWLTALFPRNPAWITLLITLLFIAHPAHIEVVASIKSRDEILAALFGLKAFEMLYKIDFSKPWITKTFVPSLFFFISLMSKESIITFVPVVAVTFFILKNQNIKNAVIRSLPFAVAALLYMGLRQLIVGGVTFDVSKESVIHNTLFAPLSTSDTWGTKLEFIIQYLRILVWPYPLSWDYSYNQLPVVSFTSFISISSLLIHLLLLSAGFLLIRKRPVYSFCIFYYFITFAVTNNILMVQEATVSERFLFLPTAAFCIVLAELLKQVFNTKQYKLFITISLLIIVYAVIVWQHSPVWKNNLSLFEAGAEASPQSARANLALATTYREIAENSQVPDTSKSYYSKAIIYYNKGLNIFQDDPGIYTYLGLCYYKTGDTASALSTYKTALRKRPDDKTTLHEVALIYANKNLPDSSIRYAEKFVENNPTIIDGYLMLTGSYFVKKDFYKAYEYAQKAWQTDSTNTNAIRNMAGVLQALGRMQEADYYLKKMK